MTLYTILNVGAVVLCTCILSVLLMHKRTEYRVNTNAIRLALIYNYILQIALKEGNLEVPPLIKEHYNTIIQQAEKLYFSDATLHDCISYDLIKYAAERDDTFRVKFDL